jgi:ABC-type polysaccharide/polyol phosphate transport system ATPase subunit
MDEEVAISVHGLHKTFRLPHDQHSGIKQHIINVFRRKKVKGYENQHVLKGLDFEIKKGEFFGIVGRNGSGKSTLLKLLAGIYVPDKGHVSINGSLVPFIELGVGFNPELTGRENVFLNGALLGFSRKQMEAMYEEIVDFAELHKFMDQKLKNYSSGMQVRLAFSIAIRAKSDILVLDEVLAVGDEAFQKKCNTFFNDIKRDRNKTVVLVTHSMDSVRRYCDKALMIEKGKIVAFGPPQDVADDYSKQFIDSDTSIKEQNRLGSGEVVYRNVEHNITDESFELDFDIVNKTNTKQRGITMGIDFCVNDDIIIGNDTRFLEEFKNGIELAPRAKSHFTIKFPNNFGNQSFTVNMNITTELGMNLTDHMRPAIAFDSTNTEFSDAWKVLVFPEIIQSKESINER